LVREKHSGDRLDLPPLYQAIDLVLRRTIAQVRRLGLDVVTFMLLRCFTSNNDGAQIAARGHDRYIPFRPSGDNVTRGELDQFDPPLGFGLSILSRGAI
jgi:hypothetical protein